MAVFVHVFPDFVDCLANVFRHVHHAMFDMAVDAHNLLANVQANPCDFQMNKLSNLFHLVMDVFMHLSHFPLNVPVQLHNPVKSDFNLVMDTSFNLLDFQLQEHSIPLHPLIQVSSDFDHCVTDVLGSNRNPTLNPLFNRM